MKVLLSILILSSLATSAVAAPFLGAGNDSCATATVLGAGTHTGLQLYDVWHPVPFNPDGAYDTDFDWYRFTLQPGETLNLAVNITSASGTSASSYFVFPELHEFSPATCSGATITAAYFTTNTSATAKDYVFLVFAFGLVSHADLYLNYDLVVQIGVVPGAVSYCPGALNSLNLSGRLLPSGSTSISTNAFQFNASNLTPNSFALLACGTASTNVPFGDGQLCITGSFTRLTLGPTTGAGLWSAPLDIANLPASAPATPGSRLYFQLYYRDVGGPGGTGFNMTNALMLTFAP